MTDKKLKLPEAGQWPDKLVVPGLIAGAVVSTVGVLMAFFYVAPGGGAAVVSIIATIDVPICFMITRLIPSSIHPVVLREGGMSPEMGMCVGLCALGMMLVGFVLYRTRFNQVRLTQRVEALKETLDDER